MHTINTVGCNYATNTPMKFENNKNVPVDYYLDLLGKQSIFFTV